MIYTLCWESKEFGTDIKVNREQKIEDTLQILWNGGILPAEFRSETHQIFSGRKEVYINTDLNYEEAEIYNGDILYIQ